MVQNGNVVHVTDNEFAQVTDSEQLVVVDFWAEWCGPCRYLGPIVEELGQEMKGKVTFAKLNVDENPETPMKFGIMGIPTLIAFKKGQAVGKVVGAAPKDQLKAWVEKHL